jgi:hypothetical protein
VQWGGSSGAEEERFVEKTKLQESDEAVVKRQGSDKLKQYLGHPRNAVEAAPGCKGERHYDCCGFGSVMPTRWCWELS